MCFFRVCGSIPVPGRDEMRIILPIVFLTCCAAFGYGLQEGSFNLLDPPSMGSLGFQNYHSTATFSLISGSRGSWGRGAYIGTMNFALHPKVTALVDLGYARTFDFSAGDNFGHMLGGLKLEWKPSENSTFVLQYSGAIPTGRIEGF